MPNLSVAANTSRFYIPLPEQSPIQRQPLLCEKHQTSGNTLKSLSWLLAKRAEVKAHHGELVSLNEKLLGVVGTTPTVYLRSNENGVYFSQHRGISVRLGLSDGGYSKATSLLSSYMPGLRFGGAKERVEIDDMLATLNTACKADQDELQNVLNTMRVVHSVRDTPRQEPSTSDQRISTAEPSKPSKPSFTQRMASMAKALLLGSTADQTGHGAAFRPSIQ